ncbi:hypothetical protein B0T16DRAFT_420650 [Cercophora newfieldiana]|uniref:C2H2-type domain-containing protein n=1 Tax=Cercophora newfieldiana TaxID=92897 RepID=A0AA40CK37_9PEZI|nr:hypothetical protein B0T16DRAFT_420650 [Cercophora newfieldiana]
MLPYDPTEHHWRQDPKYNLPSPSSTSQPEPEQAPQPEPQQPAQTEPQQASQPVARQDTAQAHHCGHNGCQKSFVLAKQLSAHIKSVHEPRKFKCEESGCNKAFGEKKGLQRHGDTRHRLLGPELPCPASGCNATFPQLRRDNLRRHIMKVHQQQQTKLLSLAASPR